MDEVCGDSFFSFGRNADVFVSSVLDGTNIVDEPRDYFC
jgi:hypothetical protein